MAKLEMTNASGWTDRVIPLPKRCSVRGQLSLRPAEARVVAEGVEAPVLDAAREELCGLAAGGGDAPFTILLGLADGPFCPRELAAALAERPNADQAYAIRTLRQGGQPTGMLLAANTALGLFYASLTLSALARPQGDGSVLLPVCEVDDWPDLEERGQWGGSSVQDIEWLARRKMNLVETHARCSVADDGRAVAALPQDLLERGERAGVRIVPIISHLESLVDEPTLARYPELAATPKSGAPLPTDYKPSLCMSEPRTRWLLTEWMRQLLAPPQVSDLMAWLSEELMSACYCERCGGQEPYSMEVKALVEAFREASKEHPGHCLRLLTTQGSYDVNDRVLAAAPPDVKVSYYDGMRTYDSSCNPMIYPLMEEFARSGRWLGVYPQLTGSWRTIFPLTSPQLVHGRMTEFADKKLSCVIGYIVPANRFYEFNVTAAAEWGWNSGGRSPRDFARAWACARGLGDPDGFAEWAMAAGELGWDLAGSRFVERLVFDPARLRPDSQAPIWPGGEAPDAELAASFPDTARLDEAIQKAGQCVEMAERLGASEALAESRAVLAVHCLMRASWTLNQAGPESPEVREALATLSESAAQMERHVHQWGMVVSPAEPQDLHARFRDTVDVAAWAATKVFDWARGSGVEDPHPELRWRRVGSWSADDFTDGPDAELRFDVSACVDGPGPYGVGFEFESGAYGLTVREVELCLGSEVVAAVPRRLHACPGEWRIEYWIDISPDTAERARAETRPEWVVVARVTGVPQDAPPERRSSSGRVFFRKACRGRPS